MGNVQGFGGQTAAIGSQGLATAAGDAQANQALMQGMQGLQNKVETESKMQEFIFNLAKGVRDKWPAGR